MTSRLGTGKSITFFYSVSGLRYELGLTGGKCDTFLCVYSNTVCCIHYMAKHDLDFILNSLFYYKSRHLWLYLVSQRLDWPKSGWAGLGLQIVQQILNLPPFLVVVLPAVLQNMICIACNSLSPLMQSNPKGNRLSFATAPKAI